MISEELKSKIVNMLVSYFTAIMKNNMDEVKHFIKEQPLLYGNKIVEEMSSKNARKMYDELNISNINLIKEEQKDDSTILTVSVLVKYLDYVMDIDTGNVLSGNNNYRIEKNYKLELIKKNNTKESSIINRCPGCNHSLDINASGKCPYCGAIFNQEDYDYQILTISE